VPSSTAYVVIFCGSTSECIGLTTFIDNVYAIKVELVGTTFAIKLVSERRWPNIWLKTDSILVREKICESQLYLST